MIIDAIHHSKIPGAHYAYLCVLVGVFVTALYTFRALILTFHGSYRSTEHDAHHVHESGWVVWLPLVILAVPSVVSGVLLLQPMLDLHTHVLINSSLAGYQPSVMNAWVLHPPNAWSLVLHALKHPPLFLALGGMVSAVLAYGVWPSLPDYAARRGAWMYRILQAKFGFDAFNDKVFVQGSRGLGQLLFKVGDVACIDRGLVLGSAGIFRSLAYVFRKFQTGLLYHYALWMVLGLWPGWHG